MYYHNETLFSEIYLEEITRQTENADVLASLKVLGEYREYANTHNLKAWKESYVHEVLSALGFFAQSTPTPSSGGGFESDHLTNLFSMGSFGKENPLSLCYVVLPDENLDNTAIGRNWAEKIIRALRKKNLQWGLLTNGKQWRIYHQDEPTPYETYLEIDLEAILDNKANDAYQIFYKFMKAENFVVHEDGRCQFDHFKKESQDKIDYIEKELANALKQREEGGKGVLSDLCMGYVEELRRKKEGDLDDEDLRKKIYHGAMLYMFRLLFLFYADSRRLLSDENHELLAKVEVECRARHDSKDSSDPAFPIWDSLEHIFVDIDQTYNGGLFSPQESEFTRFLSDTRIGDAYLASVIFNLTTYREKNGQEKPISYRDMSVRHLGTLYEGLLEHKLFVANEDTEVKLAKGKIQFIPASQGGRLIKGHYIKAGDAYFASDPSERKSTGSYYTPEYIVDYIVRNTVGEKLKELKEAFLKDQRPTLDAYRTAVDEDEHHAMAALLEENALAFVREQVLNLSVLDPAMGSGHFLVNATNLISNFITEILNEIGIQGNLETGTGYWRRWVVENCIYGVDINPLAVELAKLSLWILSMAKNQPLSFLNHHLKCGNSLVGAKLDEIGNYPFSTIKKELRQLNLFERDPDFKAAVEEVIAKSRLMAGKATASLEDVHAKKVWLEEIDQILEGYKAICDVHISLYFGNTVEESKYSRMVQKKDFNYARSRSIPNQYFHWELEFPTLFLTDKRIDCIIGNPPYVVVNDLQHFPTIRSLKETRNLYSFFIELSTSLLCSQGYLSFIIPLSAFASTQMEPLQNLLKNEYYEIHCDFFSWRPSTVFEDVNIPTTVFSAKRKNESHCRLTYYSSNIIRWRNSENPIPIIHEVDSTKYLDLVPGYFPRFGNVIELSIIKKMALNENLGKAIRKAKPNEEEVFYRSSGGLYFKIVTDFSSGSTQEVAITTGNARLNKVLVSALSSNLFFWFYDCFADSRHLTSNNLQFFPFSISKLDSDIEEKLFDLCSKLMTDYKKNAEIKIRNYSGIGEMKLMTFYAKKSKPLIDKIDQVLGEHYKFSNEEIEYIINYISEYRNTDQDD